MSLSSSTYLRARSSVGGRAALPVQALFWTPWSRPFINADQRRTNWSTIRTAGPPFGPRVHHSDRGSQYLSIKYTERLAEAKIAPSVGSVGDSYDNALAETINGLFKAEVIHRRGPWRNFEAVEYATLEWVDWFNNRRLLEPIGNIPPAEAEANFYAALERSDMAAQLRQISLRQTRRGSRSMSDTMTSQMVTDAMMMAIWRRGRPKELLHHSDQGSQYTSEPFQRLIADNGVTCSMSRSGNVGTMQQWKVSSHRSKSNV
jgi:putative transposase